ncbi:MAG: hypothetical protein Q9167_007271 [Letrouitia subvulpina]
MIRAQVNVEREAEGYSKYSRFNCSQPPKKEKPKGRKKMKDLYDAFDSGEFEILDADFKDDYASTKAISSNDCWYANQNHAYETLRKTWKRAADVIIIPYESHIGAVIGNRYVLRSLVDAKPCYDIYDADDALSFNKDRKLIAKAYKICGTKGKERDARVKNLKRNTAKQSLIDMIDQNGKKWLFFPDSSCQVIDNNTWISPRDWHGEEKYQLHFPTLNPCHRILSAPEARYPKSYASCLHGGQVETGNRFKGKNQRARNRQRRKRKENRFTKALTLGSMKAQESTPDKNCSLAEKYNPTSTYNGSTDLDDDLQTAKFRSRFNVQERGSKTSGSLALTSDLMEGLQKLNKILSDKSRPRDDVPTPTLPALGETLPQRKARLCENCNSFLGILLGDISSSTVVERYLQALDTTADYERFHGVKERIWQRLTTGPATGLKNRFSEIVEELETNLEVEKVRTYKAQHISSRRQRTIDFLTSSSSALNLKRAAR